MELIRDWLNGRRDYIKGVSLYFQYGKNDNLKSLLKKEGETAFKREKLLAALIELWEGYTKSQSADPVKFEKKKEAPEDVPYRWAKSYADPVLSSLKDNWQKCYSEMKMLQHRLLEIDSIEERCAAAHRILDLDDLCDEFYVKRDYYLEHGKLPEDPKPDFVGDPAKWPIKLNNARRYIRDYRNKLKKDPENVRYAAKVKQYEDEVAYYEDILKIHAD